MNTTHLDKLEDALEECWLVVNSDQDRSELIAVNDKVLGLVSVCNTIKDFTPSERLRFDSLYEEAIAACGKARRMAYSQY